jgi:hypothetical protein
MRDVLWHIDPLPGNDLETDNETTAVAIQTTLLFNPFLGN